MNDETIISSVFLITGKVQGGKTTYLKELVELLKRRGLTVGGFLCPGRFDAGERSGFNLENISTGKELPMASVRETSTWLKYRRFWFNPDAFTQGKEWIRKGMLEEHQVMVIDEVGPMELERSGWSELLDNLAISRIQVQLWSVREKMVREVMQQWSIPAGNTIDITEVKADLVADRIKGIILKNQESNQNQ